MSIYLPSTGGKDPFWGPQTSHMNFCEEDYHMTSYIGEFINTLTSLFYTYLGVHGIFTIRSRGEKGLIPLLPYLAVIVLGICSALYHMTLKYPMQLLDDNSMLFGAGVMLHRLLTYLSPPRTQLLSAIIINIFICVAIYLHIQAGESTFHQIVFATMMIVSAFKTARLITTTVKERHLRRGMRGLGSVALALFITGYILWNIDNLTCERLRAIRHTIGLPWAWLLELHGWWHILTGTAVYLQTLLSECLCQPVPIPLTDRIPSWASFRHADTASSKEWEKKE